jgi:hypothetical protein
MMISLESIGCFTLFYYVHTVGIQNFLIFFGMNCMMAKIQSTAVPPFLTHANIA